MTAPDSVPPAAVPADMLLLCVDMQPVFVQAVAHGADVLRRCAFAVACAQQLGVPVMFTEQVPDKLGATDPTLRALAPTSAVYPKRAFSALGDDAVRRAILEETATEHILLCGVETSVCVYQTAIAALGQGLEVTILSDAVGARRPDDARTCLDALGRAGAHLLPTETIFYALVHDASHPFFREYTRLVKAHA